MNFNKINSLLLAMVMILATSACEYGDTNVDPTSLNEDQVSVSLLLPGAIMQLGYATGSLGGRNPGMFMQYFQGQDAQQLAYTQYNITDNAMNNFWRTGMYGGVMKDLDLIIEKTTGENAIDAPYYRGIARVMMANSLGILTTFFGDVPYSEAFQGDEGIIQPAYDTQAEIYTSIQQLLEEGIADLSGDAGVLQPGGDDFIHGGDADLWVKTAYGLLARYQLQQSNYDAAAAALADALGSNADNALFPFEATITGANPFWLFENDRTATMLTHPNFRSIMSGDPRYDEYIGATNGFADQFWTSQGSPLKLVTYSEVKMMEAEIEARAGNTAGAMAAMEAGIRANMEVMEISPLAIDQYLGGVSDADVQTVMDEKYKLIYPLTEVAWADQRRTGFPDLTPNREIRSTITTIPQRFPYPNSEDLYNQENKDAARSRLGISSDEDNLFLTLPVFQ
jgi:hypothetical protein